MRPTWITAVFAAVGPAFVEGTVSTFSQTGCVTKESTKSTNKIPTSTTSATLTFKPKITVITTSTTTVIPASTTVTAITTSTTTFTKVLSQETNTATSTISYTETDFSTTTITSTQFATVTEVITSTPVLTISTPAGFTPLASALAAQGYSYGTMRKRSEAGRIAEAEDEDKSGLEARAIIPTLVFGAGIKQYPVAVSCYRFVQVISTSTVQSTAKTTKTVTATPGTVTVTSTITEPTTSTSRPFDASTTVTTSTTTTITETPTATSVTTSTLTSTTTSFAPIATSYLSCGSDNRVSSINGASILGGYQRYGIATAVAPSAYDCCVLCAQSNRCGASFFSAAGGNRCVLVNTPGTCNPAGQVIEIATGASSFNYVVSNSNCGQAYYDGN